MNYFVYLIVTKNNNKIVSYVGYTNNLSKRLAHHNESRGAKFTRGRKWKFIYTKKYHSKKKAMSEEYRLKKDSKLRKEIKDKFFNA